MQMQADLSRVVVERPVDLESTARGAALLAGVGAGLLSLDDASRAVRVDRRFEWNASASDQAEKLRGWQAAVARARGLPPSE
jgi:glycerol kinase